jgi:multiple sugar transport system substrate-binding protein/raffinose/stachyose/melibiose transport system substrate-binding protein
MFYFTQGRGLMLYSGSWDQTSLRALAPFSIGIFAVPMPNAGAEGYGRFCYGPGSDLDITTSLPFGLVKQSAYPELALDFLRYLTSRNCNEKFVALSGWLPSVVGVKLPPAVVSFAPNFEGYVDGFDLRLLQLGANTDRVFQSQLHVLLQSQGSEKAFTRTLAKEWPDAIRQDLEHNCRMIQQNLERQDALWAARCVLANAGDAQARAEIDPLGESQTQQESALAWIQSQLAQRP